ncbi:MAG: hypothetical protein WBQ17_09570 [Rhizomicrobium sp.]
MTKQTEPANAGTGDFCNLKSGHEDCSFVLMQAYKCEFGSCTNGHLAPQDGTIDKISLKACAPGSSFVLQIATADATAKTAKVISSGPVINYKGDPNHCSNHNSKIESFVVNVPIQKGDYLAIDAEKVGFVNCSDGGENMPFAMPASGCVTDHSNTVPVPCSFSSKPMSPAASKRTACSKA